MNLSDVLDLELESAKRIFTDQDGKLDEKAYKKYAKEACYRQLIFIESHKFFPSLRKIAEYQEKLLDIS